MLLQTCLNVSLILSCKQELKVKVTISNIAMKMTALWSTETTAHQLALSPYLHCSITPSDASSLGIGGPSGGYRVQSAPLICTSVISTLRLFARHASSPIWVYAMSMAVNFAYKHQSYMHDSVISTQSFGPSAMTCFSYTQLGWHSAHKTSCRQPLNDHWDAINDI